MPVAETPSRPASDDGLRAFRRRIAQTPLLSPEDERALARRIEKGDDEARRRLIEANLRLVVHLARPLHRGDPRISLMELVQEGTVGLIKAAERFDHRREVRFSTYASWWIRQALHAALDERLQAIRMTATSLDRAGDEPLAERLADDDAPTAHADVVAGERRDQLAALIDHLGPRERRVLELRFGLGDHKPLTAREAARELGTTPAKLGLVEDRALRRLRALPGSTVLRSAA